MAAAAYAVAAQLDWQSDVIWTEPNELVGHYLPLIASSFLLDPDFLPRMASSARYMAEMLAANDRSPMPRCAADEIVYCSANRDAASSMAERLELDPVLARLGIDLDPQFLSDAVGSLSDLVLDDDNVEYLYRPEFDGLEQIPGFAGIDAVNLRPRDRFVPFGYITEPVV